MSAYRPRTLPLFPEMPPPAPGVRRMVCACGCGRWYYAPRVNGRPPAYATAECAERARFRRRVKRGEFQPRAREA